MPAPLLQWPWFVRRRGAWYARGMTRWPIDERRTLDLQRKLRAGVAVDLAVRGT